MKTKKSGKGIVVWDVLFLLSSWQIFNLKIWQEYLAGSVSGNAYYISALILIAFLVCFIYRRGIRLGLDVSGKSFWYVLVSIIFLALLIPIGLRFGFLTLNPRLGWNTLTVAFAYIAFVGAPEELVFRGILQSLLEKSLKRPWLAILISNSLFATIYTHITGQGIFPNWTYVSLAFAAGLVYAISYRKSKNILVPIFVHGLVDAIWRVFLT